MQFILENLRLCAQTKWECGSGECLPMEMRCDGLVQCKDKSDELHCVFSKLIHNVNAANEFFFFVFLKPIVKYQKAVYAEATMEFAYSNSLTKNFQLQAANDGIVIGTLTKLERRALSEILIRPILANPELSGVFFAIFSSISRMNATN
uniref:Uncharacterized protein n=1 Tax=Parascaris equorum TaxID=6256 RepID=A0A914RX05_PAREQ